MLQRPSAPASDLSRQHAAQPDEGAASNATGAAPRVAGSGNECARCCGRDRVCPSCVQRRRYAWWLVTERGDTVEQAAEVMQLPPDRVGALVEEETDRRELRSLKCDSISVAETRGVIDEALARDPHLTLADIARWLDMHQVDFERAFLGKPKRGSPKRRVSVGSASRLMLALGRAPYELPGC